MHKKTIISLLLALSVLSGGTALAQKFETTGSDQFFNDGTHSPKSDDSDIVKDIIIESSNDAKTGGLTGNEEGAEGFAAIMKIIRNYFKPFLLIVASFMVTWAGIELVIGRKGEDENWKENIREVLWVGLGLFVITASIFVVENIFFGTQGELVGTEVDENQFQPFGKRGYDEMAGVTMFLTSLVIAAGVILTIISSFQLIFMGHSEEQMTKLKQRIIWGIVGTLVVFMSKTFIIEKYFFPDVTNKTTPQLKPPKFQEVIADIVDWISFFAGYISLIAVVAIIAAGIYMIVHFGDEEKITKSKNIIKWCIVGLILAFSAWTIIYFFGAPTADVSGAGTP